ncbi:hypothetical protein HOG48_06050 [Candidatus Peregrinibacteria bacterium]|jgi:hypothetical protein|nr:hypothetical protein [Candidatus Peregrinibacteria bacterium]
MTRNTDAIDDTEPRADELVLGSLDEVQMKSSLIDALKVSTGDDLEQGLVEYQDGLLAEARGILYSPYEDEPLESLEGLGAWVDQFRRRYAEDVIDQYLVIAIDDLTNSMLRAKIKKKMTAVAKRSVEGMRGFMRIQGFPDAIADNMELSLYERLAGALQEFMYKAELDRRAGDLGKRSFQIGKLVTVHLSLKSKVNAKFGVSFEFFDGTLTGEVTLEEEIRQSLAVGRLLEDTAYPEDGLVSLGKMIRTVNADQVAAPKGASWISRDVPVHELSLARSDGWYAAKGLKRIESGSEEESEFVRQAMVVMPPGMTVFDRGEFVGQVKENCKRAVSKMQNLQRMSARNEVPQSRSSSLDEAFLDWIGEQLLKYEAADIIRVFEDEIYYAIQFPVSDMEKVDTEMKLRNLDGDKNAKEFLMDEIGNNISVWGRDMWTASKSDFFKEMKEWLKLLAAGRHGMVSRGTTRERVDNIYDIIEIALEHYTAKSIMEAIMEVYEERRPMLVRGKVARAMRGCDDDEWQSIVDAYPEMEGHSIAFGSAVKDILTKYLVDYCDYAHIWDRGKRPVFVSELHKIKLKVHQSYPHVLAFEAEFRTAKGVKKCVWENTICLKDVIDHAKRCFISDEQIGMPLSGIKAFYE